MAPVECIENKEEEDIVIGDGQTEEDEKDGQQESQENYEYEDAMLQTTKSEFELLLAEEDFFALLLSICKSN
jgi:hypothetical protein